MEAGVPHGTVLSRTLFTIFINDVFMQTPSEVSYSLYADDCAVWVSDKGLQSAIHKMQNMLNLVEKWTHKWGLVMSTTKTKSVIFTYRNTVGAQALKLHNTSIEFVPHIKFLSIYFDRRLTWRFHIQQVVNKCKKDLQLMSCWRQHVGCKLCYRETSIHNLNQT